jgi:acyl-CoA thioester hydrolase
MPSYARTFELRWSDGDANGHIRHSVYAELGAETRIGWLAERGFPWKRLEELGVSLVLLREELSYRREIGIGERVRLDLRILGLSPDAARWKIVHDLTREDGSLAAQIVASGGWIDLGRRRLVAPPAEIAAVLLEAERAQGFEELPPLSRRES